MMTYWTGYSDHKLSEMEYKIFSNLMIPFQAFDVPVSLDGEEMKIWTLCSNRESKNTPLVLLHGFAAGIGIWCLNLDSLAKDRPVYVMDIIGFGRSTRPEFVNSGPDNEQKIVRSIEEWRKYLKLDKLFLLGHSMGGYLATSYTLAYPEAVKLLILVDPWGFSDKFDYPPAWLKVLSFLFDLVNFNPLAYLRCLGPFGPLYIRATRDDIIKHFKDYLKDSSTMSNYIYLCNAHPNPTGEKAFYSMIAGIGWAKKPMIRRICNLKREIPIKMMYGSNTWMDKDIGRRIKDLKPDSLVDVEIVEHSEHHIYADQAEKFNEIVNNTCESIERNKAF